jgi:hypothetical protein
MNATVAAPTGNQFGVLLAIFLVITFATVVVYWNHERRMDRNEDTLVVHDEQLATLAYQMAALLEYLGIDIPPAVEDDSPAAEEAHVDQAATERDMGDRATAPGDDAKTDEIPIVQPDTEPMAVVNPTPAVQARRDAAWDEQRSSPVPRYDSDEAKARKAAWVEAELEKIRARIDAAQEAL